MKSIILKGINSNNRPNNRFNSNDHNNSSFKTIKLPSYNGKPLTKDNLHELSNELIFESKESEENAVVTEDLIENNDSTVLVNSTIANKINP